MTYLVTGGTGRIGRELIPRLLARGGQVHVLVRPGSVDRFAEARRRWGAEAGRVVPIVGDVTAERCGVDEAALTALRGRVDHVVHLAGVQDHADTDPVAQQRVNVDGAANAVRLAETLGTPTFHHVSSWVVAGAYDGIWREDMFAEWRPSRRPHVATKHAGEAVVRRECRVPLRVYRPGLVVGRSDTGETVGLDGLYQFFPALQRLGRLLPSWLPLPVVEGGFVNVVPVDHVARALDHLVHLPGLDGSTLHVTNPVDERITDVLQAVAEAAHGHRPTIRLDRSTLALLVPGGLRGTTIELMPTASQLFEAVLQDSGVPPALGRLLGLPTRFSAERAEPLLRAAGIECPPFASYADAVWRHWVGHLAPSGPAPPTLADRLAGALVVVTGASSGIGRALAVQVGAAGATVVLVARRADALETVAGEVRAAGGTADVRPTDLSDPANATTLAGAVLADHGRADVLVNNAARSIMRLVEDSTERLHDYERLIRLNYLSPVALTLGLVPSMREQGRGHVVNVLSAGVQALGPGFSAYCASKSALEAFGRLLDGELGDAGISVTNVYMGLVRTPMSAPTRLFDEIPALSAEDAAAIVARAMVERRPSVSVEPVAAAQRVLWDVRPGVAAALLRSTTRNLRAFQARLLEHSDEA